MGSLLLEGHWNKMRALIFLGICLSGALGLSVRQLQADRCRHLCTQQYSPVCGSDGRTYSNICEFGIVACEYQLKGQILKVVSHGRCHDTTGATKPPQNVDCDAFCDEEVHHVCASDGSVYDNTCLFKRAACEAAKNNDKLSIVTYADTCPTPKAPNCTAYEIDTSDLAIEGGASIVPRCPHTHHYTCASDGHTYTNECQLCHHMEIAKDSSLMILADAPCQVGSGWNLGGLFGSGR